MQELLLLPERSSTAVRASSASLPVQLRHDRHRLSFAMKVNCLNVSSSTDGVPVKLLFLFCFLGLLNCSSRPGVFMPSALHSGRG